VITTTLPWIPDEVCIFVVGGGEKGSHYRRFMAAPMRPPQKPIGEDAVRTLQQTLNP
jgi:hypothetical protein